MTSESFTAEPWQAWVSLVLLLFMLKGGGGDTLILMTTNQFKNRAVELYLWHTCVATTDPGARRGERPRLEERRAGRRQRTTHRRQTALQTSSSAVQVGLVGSHGHCYGCPSWSCRVSRPLLWLLPSPSTPKSHSCLPAWGVCHHALCALLDTPEDDEVAIISV
eukprot:g82515.t1